MIVTFYSYKGGVGRTQMLVNLAAYLCHFKNKKILLLDWDFEAPGLPYFFQKSDDSKPGTIDLFIEYSKNIHRNNRVEESAFPDIQAGGYIQKLVDSTNGGKIDLISAGRYDSNYTSRVNDFNWYEFYEQCSGKVYIEYLKEKFASWGYDYIFLDSRTGISDYSGICNIQFPDLNIIVVGPTNQSMQGCKKVCQSILNSDYVKAKNRKEYILPVFSRIDLSTTSSEIWLSNFEKEFEEVIQRFYQNAIPSERLSSVVWKDAIKDYSKQTCLMYKKEISVGENLLIQQKTEVQTSSIVEQYSEIAEIIEHCSLKENSTYNPQSKLIQKFYPTSAPRDPKLAEMSYQLAKLFREQGNHYDAIINYEDFLRYVPTRASEKDKLWNVYPYFVFWSVEQGNIVKAREFVAKLVEYKPAFESSLEEFDLMQTWVSALLEVSPLKKAEELKKLYQKQKEKKLEENLLWIVYQLSKFYIESAQYQEAIGLLDQFINKTTDQEYPFHYIYLLLTKSSLYMELAKYEESEKSFQESDKIIKERYGKDSAISIEYLLRYGGLLDSKGEYGEALKYYQQALDICLKKLGEEHPHTATSYGNIGNTYDSKGDYDKALGYYKKTLDIQLKKLGEEHPNTATSYNNIGLIYNSKGDYDKALEYYKKTLDIQLKKLGEEHPSTATSYNNIGLIYNSKGDYDKALEYYKKTLDIQLKKLGAEHSNTATSYGNIGLIYNSKGDYDKALEYHQKALDIELKKLGAEHPNTATSYNNIGLIYNSKGDYGKALEYYLKALDIQLKKLGEEHPNTATSYSNIGHIYYSKGDYDKALEHHQKALDIELKKLGAEHPNTATSYNNIGLIYHSKGEYGRALEYHLKALDIQLKKLGAEHSNTATSYSNIGSVYSSKGDYDKALEYYLKALNIRLKKLGEEHPDTATSYNNIGHLYYSKKNLSKAVENFSLALKIRKKVLGKDHPNTKAVYKSLKDCFKEMGYNSKEVEVQIAKLA